MSQRAAESFVRTGVVARNVKPHPSPSAGTLSQRAAESFVSTGVVARNERKLFTVLNHYLWLLNTAMCYMTSFLLKDDVGVKYNQTPNSLSARTLSQRATESFVSTGAVAWNARKFYGVKPTPPTVQTV